MTYGQQSIGSVSSYPVRGELWDLRYTIGSAGISSAPCVILIKELAAAQVTLLLLAYIRMRTRFGTLQLNQVMLYIQSRVVIPSLNRNSQTPDICSRNKFLI